MKAVAKLGSTTALLHLKLFGFRLQTVLHGRRIHSVSVVACGRLQQRLEVSLLLTLNLQNLLGGHQLVRVADVGGTVVEHLDRLRHQVVGKGVGGFAFGCFGADVHSTGILLGVSRERRKRRKRRSEKQRYKLANYHSGVAVPLSADMSTKPTYRLSYVCGNVPSISTLPLGTTKLANGA
jgi:hypothetical protein